VALPGLPAGSYRVYADVTDESGFAQTLTESVEVPEPATEPGPPPSDLEPDPDDSWHVGGPASGVRHAFDDGFVMVRETDGEPVTAGREMTLAFTLEDAGGEPASLEPYMGMTSHAAVRRHDGAVFVHLHPTGTISMAAQQLFERRQADAAPIDHSMHSTHPDAVTRASMPYEFPRPGRYRIWVQLKSGGKVYTGVYDVEVGEAG
jgi:hypothetical protein